VCIATSTTDLSNRQKKRYIPEAGAEILFESMKIKGFQATQDSL